ncbi:MAG: hypothetical protein ACETWG_01590 [Candidatus Neomarinimicrobiota bacterium]
MITPVYSPQVGSALFTAGHKPPLPSSRRETTLVSQDQTDVSADLSPLAVLLSEEGLDFSASSVEAVAASMDFNLEFTSSSVERLSVSGYYSEETESLNLSWHFIFQQEVAVDGRSEVRTFEADLNVSVSQVSRKTVTPFTYKEDILSLVRRLMQSINEIAADDDRVLGGVVLDYKDFREIFALDNGRLAHDLMALIELTIMLARLKQLLDNNEDVVILAPERQEIRGVSVTEASMRVGSFHLEIRDVTTELSTPDAGVPAAADTQDGEVNQQWASQAAEEPVPENTPVPS